MQPKQGDTVYVLGMFGNMPTKKLSTFRCLKKNFQ